MQELKFHQFGRPAKTLAKVRNGALTLRDVKNEDRPGYVYENKGDCNKMSCEKPSLYTKMHDERSLRTPFMLI